MQQKFLAIIFIALGVSCGVPVAPLAPNTLTAPTPLATLTLASSLPTTVPSTIAVRERFPLRDLPGIGRHPGALAALDGKIYVANFSTDNVGVIQDNRVVKFIPVGKGPSALAVDPAQKRVYVSNANDKTISIITNDQVTATQTLSDSMRALAFFENKLYAGSDSKGTVFILDPETLKVQSTIPIPNAFTVIALAGDAAHHRMYANIYERTVVIETNNNMRLAASVPLKGSYVTIAANQQTNTVYLTNYETETQSEFLVELDAATGAQKGRVKIPGDPRSAVLSADSSRLYLSNSYKPNLTVINTRDLSVAATIPMGNSPSAVALDENAHRVYVANQDSDNVIAVNTDNNQIVATIPLGMMPSALAANESTGRVYIANTSSDSVFVVEGAKVTREIGVGRSPIDLSRDASSNRLFVANQGDDTLSIVDEQDFSVRATQFITNYVSTIEADSARGRVFVNDVVLDAKTFAPINRLLVQGYIPNNPLAPLFVRVNPNNNRIYAIASNGVPGSNGRNVTYSIDGDTLKPRGALTSNGNTLFLTIDPSTNRLYQVETHPLAFTYALAAFDADDKRLAAIPLPAQATGLVYNPQTHHLFVAHGTSIPRPGSPPTADNTIQVFDTTTFGELARLSVNAPGEMTRLGNTIYVASPDGFVTLIQDAILPAPPAPTATFTPTPYPTSPPPSPTRGGGTPTPRASVSCATPVGSLFTFKWVGNVLSNLGCPNENAHAVSFAMQVFEHGRMFYRDDEKKIYAITDDKSWVAYDDKWTNALPEDSCLSIAVAEGKLKPKRGFGKVWCEIADLRTRIGAATSAEEGPLMMTVQRGERGLMFGVGGVAWVLVDGGKWE